ncbi:uncharacterized protein LOC132043247 isoform X6 [Lycium ferocissimum]|uniref:uncharacterized protein LOC132043247 isoform X6 n=1 Tax=Lycium ferocissimum TaxID=112874 RepID=UPI0028162D7B|nr:uncharacterized protein LOC132043247 isoform X6 [Lycium ferocissimum]
MENEKIPLPRPTTYNIQNQKRRKTNSVIKDNVEPSKNRNYAVENEERLHPLSDITNDMRTRHLLPDLNTFPILQGMHDENILPDLTDTPTEKDVQTHNSLPDLNDTPLLEEIEAAISNTVIQGQLQTNIEDDDEEEYPDVDVECGDICTEDYWDIGDATYECEKCGAIFWYEERIHKHYNSKNPIFTMCCQKGKIKLPDLKKPPQVLEQLLFGTGHKSNHFQEKIRSYNSMFSFTSMGGKVDVSVNQTQGPRTFKLFGQNYHQIGSLLPPEGSTPKFAQLYIYDTENEVANRINAVSRGQDVNKLHAEIVADLKQMLDDNNVLAKTFRMVRDRFQENINSNVKLRLIGKRGTDGRRYNLPTITEVAALVVGDFEVSGCDRDIIIETQSGQLQRINELNAAYLGLQYPLLFPYGEDGYREDIPLSGGDKSSGGRQYVSMREYFVYRIQERKDEVPTIVSSRRLFQQFLVDGYTMIESSRLKFIRTHQKQLRVDFYKVLTDAILHGDTDPSSQGKRVILPSSFTGGARYMLQNYQDAMAICKWAGYPDLFITFTCNPKWPEITRFVESRGLTPEDRPDILSRVFKIKLDGLIKDLKDNQVFGQVKADIDRIISAEIPHEGDDPYYYNVVKNLMMHGPCGSARKSSPCMQNGKCTKHFPKKFVDATTVDEEGYPVYRRRDNGRTIMKNGIELDNRYVVPHNRFLLLKYGAHINVEWCNQSRSIKYLFKYVNKGHDRATAAFSQSTHEDGSSTVDEINMYYDCRYISPCEAAWRILKFPIHHREPPVERLSFHLPNEQPVIFSDDDHIENVVNRPTVRESMFLSWFEANKEYPEARDLTYAEFPLKFRWDQNLKKWVRRKTSAFSIGRIFFVTPGSGELYYLRLLLNIIKGPISYDELRNDHSTFRDACYALGLLDDDKEYVDAIKEASNWGMPSYLRQLFVMLLLSNSMSRPEFVWQASWRLLSDDILHEVRTLLDNSEAELTDDELKNRCLQKMERTLKGCGKSFNDFPTMPRPDYSEQDVDSANRLINEELRYNKRSLTQEHQQLVMKLTAEQKCVYDKIMTAVNQDRGGLFFLYGHGGTGKTFMWRTLSSGVRSKGDIVINVASSGIASLLLPGGRTAHSRFAIPLNPTEDSTCNIKQGSPLAKLIVKAKLVIWDEAPMMHRYCFEALDRTLRDILRFKDPSNLDRPFGGKTIVLGGDFRQILPVITKGTRQEIVNATLNSSDLWPQCQVLKLTKNMRLQGSLSGADLDDLKQFSDWILAIGDGKIGCSIDGIEKIEIPDDLLIHNCDDPISGIVESTYSDYLIHSTDIKYLQERAILAPTLQMVESVNDYMVSLNHSQDKSYLSSDTICMSDNAFTSLEHVHTPEFLNSIKCSGIPNHSITLKVGVPVMLLRNIDQSAGLCNGTRLIITRLGNRVIEAKVLSGKMAGDKVFIPRMTLTPSDARIPFKFQRRQFPVIVSFAMTINKSQGQSLCNVGLFLKKPVFTHGQLYVAFSRVTNRKGLKILCYDEDGKITNEATNVVYKEVFRNLEGRNFH